MRGIGLIGLIVAATLPAWGQPYPMNTAFVAGMIETQQAPAIPTTEWVTGEALSYPRQCFPVAGAGDWSIGCSFTVGASDLTITGLGRWILDGNSQTHMLYLLSVVAGVPTIMASPVLDTSGKTAGEFAYVQLDTPIIALAGTTWAVLSHEQNAGDYWYDALSLVTTADATIIGSAYRFEDPPWDSLEVGTAGVCYVPVSFEYHK